MSRPRGQLGVDAEKIPHTLLEKSHIPQPGAPENFTRSALLVGSRGVGKTFLLRHRKKTSHPEALRIDLKETLSPLSLEGIGGGNFDLTEPYAQRVASRAAALVIVEVLRQLVDERRSALALPSQASLNRLLPRGNRTGPGRGNHAELKRLAANLETSEWPETSPTLLSEIISDVHSKLEGGLALFLDRADDVSYAAVQRLMPLLSQSLPFLTVIAVRPGALQLVVNGGADASEFAGDHYQIVHLGSTPRTPAWDDYMDRMIRRFFEMNGERIATGSSIAWASRLGRESARNSIQFLEQVRGYSGRERVEALAAQRSYMLNTMTEMVRQRNPHLRWLINRLHQRNRKVLGEGPFRPVLLEMPDLDEGASIVTNRTPVQSFVLSALRAEVLYLPAGTRWHPYVLGNTFEIAPILAWDGVNESWIR
jgi:hypothetical protein